MKLAKSVVKEIKATYDTLIHVKPVPLKDMVLICFADASFGKKPVAAQYILATTKDFL